MDTISIHVQSIGTKICQNCDTQLFGLVVQDHDPLPGNCFAEMAHPLIVKLESKALNVESEPIKKSPV